MEVIQHRSMQPMISCCASFAKSIGRSQTICSHPLLTFFIITLSMVVHPGCTSVKLHFTINRDYRASIILVTWVNTFQTEIMMVG